MNPFHGTRAAAGGAGGAATAWPAADGVRAVIVALAGKPFRREYPRLRSLAMSQWNPSIEAALADLVATRPDGPALPAAALLRWAASHP